MTATLSAVDVGYLSKIGTGGSGGGFSTNKIKEDDNGLVLFGNTRFKKLTDMANSDVVAEFTDDIILHYKADELDSNKTPISSTTICRKISNLDDEGNLTGGTISKDTLLEYEQGALPGPQSEENNKPAPNGIETMTVDEVCSAITLFTLFYQDYDQITKLIHPKEDGLNISGYTVFDLEQGKFSDKNIAGFLGNVAFEYPTKDDPSITNTKNSFDICRFIDNASWLKDVSAFIDEDDKIIKYWFKIYPCFSNEVSFVYNYKINEQTKTGTITLSQIVLNYDQLKSDVEELKNSSPGPTSEVLQHITYEPNVVWTSDVEAGPLITNDSRTKFRGGFCFDVTSEEGDTVMTSEKLGLMFVNGKKHQYKMYQWVLQQLKKYPQYNNSLTEDTTNDEGGKTNGEEEEIDEKEYSEKLQQLITRILENTNYNNQISGSNNNKFEELKTTFYDVSNEIEKDIAGGGTTGGNTTPTPSKPLLKDMTFEQVLTEWKKLVDNQFEYFSQSDSAIMEILNEVDADVIDHGKRITALEAGSGGGTSSDGTFEKIHVTGDATFDGNINITVG